MPAIPKAFSKRLLLVILPLTLSTISFSFAGNTATVTRGSISPSKTLSWTITNDNVGCIKSTSYPYSSDGIRAAWLNDTTNSSGYITITQVDSPGTYTFTCADANNTGISDTATLYVNECPAGTTWNGSSCASNPDLIVSDISPTYATSGEQVLLSTTVSNTGQTGTGAGFTTLFQMANDSNGTGAHPIATASMSAIGGGSSAVASVPYTFNKGQVYYIRACADKSSNGDTGVISETNEDNNCGSVWTPVDTRVGGILVLQSTCTIPLNGTACNTSIAWNTSRATSTVTVERAYSPYGVIATGKKGSSVPVSFAPTGSFTLNLMHDGAILNAKTIAVSCAYGSAWDVDLGKCAQLPPEAQVSLTCNYTTPCYLLYTCTYGESYSISRDGTTLVNNAAYSAPGQYPPSSPLTTEGNYTLTCSNSAGTDQETIYYDTQEHSENLIFDESPKSVESGGKTTLTWNITKPANDCRITVVPVCSGTCSAAQTAAAATLQNTLDNGTTDANDPNGGSRNMFTALRSRVSGNKAIGKKTLQVFYSTNFQLFCHGAATTTLRFNVTKNNEG